MLLAAAAMTLSACGVAGSETEIPSDPDAPVLQVRSEGGFAPVEYVLSRGPTYTLLADGRLIHEGPVAAIYPGPLLPNYLVTRVNADQMNSVLDLVNRIGLPDMDHEIDDSGNTRVADATTEVVTYWDSDGEHSYSVYALGIADHSAAATKAFSELLVVLDQLVFQGDPQPFVSERVRVLAGVGFVDPEFEDIRAWPLDETDFSDWEEIGVGFMCKVHGPEIIEIFADATGATQWTHPNPTMDAPPFTLLVRSLHPGEPDCS